MDRKDFKIMNSEDFGVGTLVTDGNKLGMIVEVLSGFTYYIHIIWDDGCDDWYADKPFRRGEIRKLC